MPLTPHDSWAEVYDLAYERIFPGLYQGLTQATVEFVKGTLSQGARIVDFGAGTGRLTIPLAQAGYRVTAVDQSAGMLEQLEKKLPPGVEIKALCQPMAEFAGLGYDGALCVFTVLLYLLDEEALTESIKAAHGALNEGGLLLIDIPRQTLFQSHHHDEDCFSRKVTVTPRGGGLYDYREQISVVDEDGEARNYEEQFIIRHWPLQTVMAVLGDSGFTLVSDVSGEFSGALSDYLLLQKTS